MFEGDLVDWLKNSLFGMTLFALVLNILGSVIGSKILMTQHGSEETERTVSPPQKNSFISAQNFRMWVYYLTGCALIMTAILFWYKLWYDILNALIKTDSPILYQIFVVVLSAILFLAVAHLFLINILNMIITSEAKYQKKKFTLSKFYNNFAVPMGIVIIMLILILGSIFGMISIRSNAVINTIIILNIIYLIIFLVFLIWQILMYLWRPPLLLNAFQSNSSNRSMIK